MNDTVLIVDDNPNDRNGLLALFDWASLQLTPLGGAANGREGLDMALTLKPDIVLTDVSMPIMDGIELANALRERLPETSVLFMSCYDDVAYLVSAIRVGARDYLFKPVDFARMRQTLMDTLEARTKRRALLCAADAGRVLTRRDRMRRFLHGQCADFADELPSGALYAIRVAVAAQGPPLTEAARGGFERSLGEACVSACEDGPHAHVLLFSPGEDGDACALRACQRLLDESDAGAVTVGLTGRESAAGLAEAHARLLDSLTAPTPPGGLVLAESFVQGAYRLPRPLEAYIDAGETGEFARALGAADELTRWICVHEFRRLHMQAAQALDGLGDPPDDPAAAAVAGPDAEALRLFDRLLRLRGREADRVAASISGDIRRIIHEEYASLESVQQISDRLYLSYSSAVRSFKRAMGQSIFDYLTAYRIEMAKKLLSDPYIRIYEVPARVGYATEAHFRAVFRDLTGMTPRAWRMRSCGISERKA